MTFLSGGAAATIIGSTLLGAGIGGLTDSIEQSIHNPNDFNWTSFGAAEASGAISGLLTGGFGAAGSELAEPLASGYARFGVELLANMAGGIAGNEAGMTTYAGITGQKFTSANAWHAAASGAIGGVVSTLIPTGEPANNGDSDTLEGVHLNPIFEGDAEGDAAEGTQLTSIFEGAPQAGIHTLNDQGEDFAMDTDESSWLAPTLRVANPIISSAVTNTANEGFYGFFGNYK